jgi:hypothetical protein
MNYELRPPSGYSPLESEDEQAAKDDPDRSQLLLEFNNALVSHLELNDLLRSIFEGLKQVFQQTTAATLSLHDPDTDELRVYLLHSNDTDIFRSGMPFPFQGTPSGLAFTSRQTLLIHWSVRVSM